MVSCCARAPCPFSTCHPLISIGKSSRRLMALVRVNRCGVVRTAVTGFIAVKACTLLKPECHACSSRTSGKAAIFPARRRCARRQPSAICVVVVLSIVVIAGPCSLCSCCSHMLQHIGIYMDVCVAGGPSRNQATPSTRNLELHRNMANCTTLSPAPSDRKFSSCGPEG